MKKILTVLLISISGTLFAQSKPQDFRNNFFATYKKDAGKAVKELYATNIWTDRIKDEVENISTTVNGFTESYMGNYFGYEIITKKKFAQSFELYSYMVKYDRQPLRFIFKFYKPNNNWVLYSFAIDDALDSEIQEAAKLYHLELDKN